MVNMIPAIAMLKPFFRGMLAVSLIVCVIFGGSGMAYGQEMSAEEMTRLRRLSYRENDEVKAIRNPDLGIALYFKNPLFVLGRRSWEQPPEAFLFWTSLAEHDHGNPFGREMGYWECNPQPYSHYNRNMWMHPFPAPQRLAELKDEELRRAAAELMPGYDALDDQFKRIIVLDQAFWELYCAESLGMLQRNITEWMKWRSADDSSLDFMPIDFARHPAVRLPAGLSRTTNPFVAGSFQPPPNLSEDIIQQYPEHYDKQLLAWKETGTPVTEEVAKLVRHSGHWKNTAVKRVSSEETGLSMYFWDLPGYYDASKEYYEQDPWAFIFKEPRAERERLWKLHGNDVRLRNVLIEAVANPTLLAARAQARSARQPVVFEVPRTLAELKAKYPKIGANVEVLCPTYDYYDDIADRADYINRTVVEMTGQPATFDSATQAAYGAKYGNTASRHLAASASGIDTVFPTRSGTYAQPTHTTGGVVAQQTGNSQPSASGYREGKDDEIWYDEVGSSKWDHVTPLDYTDRVGNNMSKMGTTNGLPPGMNWR